MAHQVFISYSTRDKEIAAEACAALEERGVDCWIAPRNISGGSDWGEAIVYAIKEARILLLIFSEPANRSEQVKREIALAVGNGLFILPLRIEDVEPRSSLQYFLSTSHWLDALERPIEPMLMHMAETVERALAEPDETKPQMGELTRMSFAVSDLPDAESEIRAAAKADAAKPNRRRGVLKETVASAAVKLHEGDESVPAKAKARTESESGLKPKPGSDDEMEGRTGRDQTRIATPAATMEAPAARSEGRAATAGESGAPDKLRSPGGRTMTMVLPVWQERFWFTKLAIVLLLVVLIVLLVTRMGGDDEPSVTGTDTLPARPITRDDPVARTPPPENRRADGSGGIESRPSSVDDGSVDSNIPAEPPVDGLDVSGRDEGPEDGGDFLLPLGPGDGDGLETDDGDPIESEDFAAVVENQVDRAERIERLLIQARDDMENQRFVSPAGGNALDRFNEVLSLDPDNVSAKVGIRRIARAYIALATDAMDKGHLSRAGSYLEIASRTDPESPDVAQAYRRLSDLRAAEGG